MDENELRQAWLEKFIRDMWTQGDNYYVALNKHKTSWTFGYTNDYPLQHGKGQNMTLSNEFIDYLMEKINL